MNIIIIILALLVLCDYAATRWGADSRDGFNEARMDLVATGCLSSPTRE